MVSTFFAMTKSVAGYNMEQKIAFLSITFFGIEKAEYFLRGQKCKRHIRGFGCIFPSRTINHIHPLKSPLNRHIVFQKYEVVFRVNTETANNQEKKKMLKII